MVENRTSAALAKTRRRELERQLKGFRRLQGVEHGLKQRAGLLDPQLNSAHSPHTECVGAQCRKLTHK